MTVQLGREASTNSLSTRPCVGGSTTGWLAYHTSHRHTELMAEALYNSENATPAYQLRWSLALFPSQSIPQTSVWLDELKTMTERDGVRILKHQVNSDTHLFLLSTRPDVAPPKIVKSVKGRLQNLIQQDVPKAFRRNFRLTSIGDANREAIEKYVTEQTGHHTMADPRVNCLLEQFHQAFPEVDLSRPQRSAHGEYLYNLHVVLVHSDRWNEIRRERLQTTFDMIVRCANAKEHRLSRLALLADHIHLTIGVPCEIAPADVALSYMNNIAFAHGMVELLRPSYYVGTFGEYDMGATRRS